MPDKRLQKNNDNQRKSFNTTVDLITNYAIFTLDLDGKITSWNKGAENIKGWTRDEVIGKYYEFLFLPKDIKKQKPKNNLNIALENGVYEAEDQRVKKDGKVFLADITLTQIHDDTGKHIGYVKVVKDITAKHKQETDQLDANELLKKEIARRKITEKALKESNAELEAFASAASHDLQEPLRMVVSYLQLIDRRYRAKFDTDGKEFLDFAIDGATRMRALISDLSEYARIDKTAKPFKEVDTNLIVDQVINNLKLSAEDSHVKVTRDSLPTIFGDPVQLNQLFQNLIANGIKFSDKKKATVHVGYESRGGDVVFSVSDNGKGIKKSEFDKIFLIFKQLGSRSQRQGSGIGLAISKKIVARHKGRLWVESKEGEGSTFYFSIPARKNNNQEN